ncbi:MAG: hypothetical protein JWM59_10 [Verrucomicrobiales bacterium]|nr:hypothetical protein [Verrucomicrobiales bacterium]
MSSVKARLLKIPTDTGDDCNELLVRFCLERFLYRLSVPPPLPPDLLPPMMELSFGLLWRPGGLWMT